jgi:transcriptional regulator with XRE-family HTH domain
VTFSQLVRQQMKAHRLSIRAVCRRAEVDPSFFAKVLRGERTPPDSERVLRRLAEALSVEPARLFLSVGRIPSEWQGRAQEPEILKSLSALFAGKKPAPARTDRVSRPSSARPAAWEPGPVPAASARKADLTEDLL